MQLTAFGVVDSRIIRAVTEQPIWYATTSIGKGTEFVCNLKVKIHLVVDNIDSIYFDIIIRLSFDKILQLET